MYVPHYAAALAVKSRVPAAPVVALIVGAFLPDLLWIVLSRLGIEDARQQHFFDDWSHSLLATLVWAGVYSALFWRYGRAVVAAIALAVVSHFVLDFPVHPTRLALYPHSGIPLGWDWSQWASAPGWLSIPNDWWLQALTLLVLLAIFVQGMWRQGLPWRTVAVSVLLLVALQLLTLFPCIGY